MAPEPPPFGIKPPANRHWPTHSTHPSTTGGGKPWWEPSQWFGDIVNFFSGIGNDVTSLITKAVSSAANLLHEDLHSVWNLTSGWIRDVVHYIEEGLNWVDQQLKRTLHEAVHLYRAAVHLAAHYYDVVRHDIAHLLDIVRHAIAWLWDALTRFVWSVLSRYVFRPLDVLVHWLAHWVDYVLRIVWKGLDWYWHHVFLPFWSDLLGVVKRVERLERTVFHDFLWAIRLIEDCADWLIWFADHTFADLEHLARGGRDDLEKWLTTPLGSNN